MLLIIPIRTDSPVRRPPRVNHVLIALNVLVYLAIDVFADLIGPGGGATFKRRWMLDPQNLGLTQFFTYQFLHGDVLHLVGNMLFLWVFGNSVNSKMGHLPYLLFYLAAGVFAGVGFALGDEFPCMGASGAIAGVTTAYLVLFPRTDVTVFYWLWLYFGTMQIQALVLIVVKIILWDNILSPRLSQPDGFVQVAYSAHMAGYVFGFVVSFLMLLIRALPRDQFDIVALAARRYRRHQLRAAMADPNAQARAMYGGVARPVSPITGEIIEAPEPPEDDIARLRREISEQVANRDYSAAAERYELLVTKDPSQCLSRSNMLVVANQLMTASRYPQAAAAYEKFLQSYPADVEAQQIKLVLGIIYAKYLHQYDAAQRCLRDCMTRLSQPDQLEQARHWFDEATAALGHGPATA